ncbi:MAG: hypothetical protein K2F99_07005 [Muribaculaceae bacterium]|nr:hypothetical protein [Muribaculaceae bacterium]
MGDLSFTSDEGKRVYEGMGLDLPDDLIERFRMHMEPPDNIPEQDGVCSWRTRAAKIWDFLTAQLQLASLPPPIAIDRRKDPPFTMIQEADGTTYQSYIIGIFNSSSCILDGRYEDEICIPVDYEVRIFEENFKRDCMLRWGNKIPLLIHTMHMDHILIHELLHYAKLADNYTDALTAQSTYAKMIEDVCNCGQFEDEKANELMSIIGTHHRCLNQYYSGSRGMFLNDTELQGTLESGLGIVIGGAYDVFMRRRNPEYELRSDYILDRAINWCQNFDQTECPGVIMPAKDEWEKVQVRIAKRFKNAWKDDGRPTMHMVD